MNSISMQLRKGQTEKKNEFNLLRTFKGEIMTLLSSNILYIKREREREREHFGLLPTAQYPINYFTR